MKKKNLKYYAGIVFLTLNMALTGCSTSVTKDDSTKEIETTYESESDELETTITEESREEREDIDEKIKNINKIDIEWKEPGYYYINFINTNDDSYQYESKTTIVEGLYDEVLSYTNCQKVNLNYLPNNDVLEEISKCKNIKKLTIYNSKIDNLEFLSNLTNLEELDIANCENIDDLTPLVTLTNLTILRINGTKVADVSPLSKLNNLKNLDLACNEITDPEVLVNLENLENIKLGCNKIEDIAKLEKFKEKGLIDEETAQYTVDSSTSRKILMFSDDYKENTVRIKIFYYDAQQEYYVEMSDENNERQAFFYTDNVYDVYGSAYDLPNCKVLVINNCPKTFDPFKISYESKFEELFIHHCNFNSLDFLYDFENLNYLVVDTCPNVIEDFDNDFFSFGKLNNLKVVKIENTNIESLENLAIIKSIEQIELSNNNLTNYDFLTEMPNLNLVIVTTFDSPIPTHPFNELREKGVKVFLNNYTMGEPEDTKADEIYKKILEN